MNLEDLKETTKLYYSISEVAKMLDINASQIRFWEKEFSFIKPKKNVKGDRRYIKKDIDNIKIVLHLLKDKKFTISGAKEHLKQKKDSLEKDIKIIRHLEDAKQRIENLEKYL
jgi:DNA-binding transcriptional MerR regulator